RSGPRTTPRGTARRSHGEPPAPCVSPGAELRQADRHPIVSRPPGGNSRRQRPVRTRVLGPGSALVAGVRVAGSVDRALAREGRLGRGSAGEPGGSGSSRAARGLVITETLASVWRADQRATRIRPLPRQRKAPVGR